MADAKETVGGRLKGMKQKARPYVAGSLIGMVGLLAGQQYLSDGYADELRKETSHVFDADDKSHFDGAKFMSLPFRSTSEDLDRIRTLMYENYGADPKKPSAEAQYAVNCGIIAASGLTGRLDAAMKDNATKMVGFVESGEDNTKEAGEALYDDVANACAAVLRTVIETQNPPLLRAPLGLKD